MADPAFDVLQAYSGGSPVKTGGTLTFQYPPARAPVCYLGAAPAFLGIPSMQADFVENVDFTVAYGATSIVVTYLAQTTIPPNSLVYLQDPLVDTSETSPNPIGN